MIAAVKVVDETLRSTLDTRNRNFANTLCTDDFGFENILWVYSGRRGVHCWVGDPRARRLTNEQRMAIGKYFAVAGGAAGEGDKSVKKCELWAPLHPSIRRAVSTLTPVIAFYNCHTTNPIPTGGFHQHACK